MSEKAAGKIEEAGRIDHTDKDVLVELYHERGLSQDKIAELADRSKSTITYWMDKHDVERRGASKVSRGELAPLQQKPSGHLFWRCRKGGEYNQISVHRLLAVAKYGAEAVADKHVHHKNGVAWDNRPENIKLLSHEDHMREHHNGEKSASSKLTQDEVREIKNKLQNVDVLNKDLAEEYGVSDGHIADIKNGNKWAHI